MDILIIEDEGRAALRLQKLIQEYCRGKGISPNFRETLDSVSSTIAYFRRQPAVDILFLDIQLSDGISFEIFEHIQIQTPVIFTTAFDEYALKAFRLHSIDYLLKPIETEALARSLDKFFSLRSVLGEQTKPNPTHSPSNIEALLQTLAQTQKSYKSRFLVPSGNGFISLDVSMIAYFVSEHKMTWLVTNDNKKYPVDFPLEDLITLLDPTQFFRANRQYILSHSAVISLAHSFNGKLKVHARPAPQEEIIIGREKAAQFKVWLDS